MLRDDKHSSGVIDLTVRTVGGCNIVDFADQQCGFKALAAGILQFFFTAINISACAACSVCVNQL